MSWLNDWGDAAKHAKRALALMPLAGLVGGGLIGYFRFDHSLIVAAILGVTFATILTHAGWKSLHDPAWVQRRRGRRRFTPNRKALLRFALPWGTLALAFVVGIATHSENVFVIVFAAGLALSLALRFTIWH